MLFPEIETLVASREIVCSKRMPKSLLQDKFFAGNVSVHGTLEQLPNHPVKIP